MTTREIASLTRSEHLRFSTQNRGDTVDIEWHGGWFSLFERAIKPSIFPAFHRKITRCSGENYPSAPHRGQPLRKARLSRGNRPALHVQSG